MLGVRAASIAAREMSKTEDELQIEVTRGCDREDLERRGVFLWEVWTKEVSSFPWTYSDRETCYLLEGEVTVTPTGGEPVQIQAGDLVVFPKHLECTWEVRIPVRKHYRYG